MNQHDLNRFAAQRTVEVATPLIAEIVERLDLDADSDLPPELLLDFAGSLFEAGFTFGAANLMAEVIERRPDLQLFAAPAPT